MKNHKSTLSLSNDDISKNMEIFETILGDAGLEKRDIIGLSLSMEEILLRWQDHFGTEKQITQYTYQRLGHTYICLSVEGEICNPLEGWDESEDLVQKIMNDRGLSPKWEYRKKTNHVWIRPKKEKKKTLIIMSAAILAAIVLGLAGRTFCPEIVQTVTSVILTPLRKVMYGMLSAVAVPLIFLSVVLGVCNVGDKNSFNLIGKKVVLRLLGISAAAVTLFGLLTFPLFDLNISNTGVNATHFSEVFDILLGMLPQNLFEPFVSGNTLQLIVLAFALGLALLLTGPRINVLIHAVEQLHDIIKILLGWITSLAPVMVILVLLELGWQGNMGFLANIWKPLLLYFAALFIIISLWLIVACHKYKLSMARLLRLMMPTLMICLSTGSPLAAFNTNLECCERGLGVDKRVSRIGVPLGTVIFSPLGTISYLLISMYCAGQFAVECSVAWLVIAIISSFLLKTTAPPVAGGNIACYTILFLQLGIPESALAIAITMDLMMALIGSVSKLIIVQLEMIFLSDKLNMLDRECLEKNAGRTRKA